MAGRRKMIVFSDEKNAGIALTAGDIQLGKQNVTNLEVPFISDAIPAEAPL